MHSNKDYEHLTVLEIERFQKTTRAIYIYMIIEKLQEYGIEPTACYAECQLKHTLNMNNEKLLSFDNYDRLIKFAIKETGHPWIGLEIVSSLPLFIHGNLGYALVSSPTPDAALNLLIKFHLLITKLVRLSRINNSSHATVFLDEAFSLGESEEFIISAISKIIYDIFVNLTGNSKTMIEVGFAFPATGYREFFQHFFSPPISFSQKRNFIRIPRKLLDSINPYRNDAINTIAESECENSLAGLNSNHHLRYEVRRIIMDPKMPFPSYSDIASRLNMSPATFIRKLKANDTSYKEIINDVIVIIENR